MFLLLTLPWLGLFAFVLLRVHLPRPLPPNGTTKGGPVPLVSVIVPARDEAVNIERCLRSLAGSAYPRFEIVVVDDRSKDDTALLACSVPPGRATGIEVVEGADLPEGWLGKPWACHQGALRARGDLLLFTDADTRHGPSLLGRVVRELQREHADLLTLAGRQLMGSFWERLVQPQVFLMLLLRFHDVEKSVRLGRWRGVIANGQFLLFTRAAYQEVGGHRAVGGEIVEDLALAQLAVRRGLRLVLRLAGDDLATRMYRSLGEAVGGWSKNVVLGARRAMPRGTRPFLVPAVLAWIAGLWIAPPVLLLLALAGHGGNELLTWAALVTGASALFWALVTRAMKAPAWYGLLYPLGAAVQSYIFTRAWVAGRRVRWKGRSYVVEPASDRR